MDAPHYILSRKLERGCNHKHRHNHHPGRSRLCTCEFEEDDDDKSSEEKFHSAGSSSTKSSMNTDSGVHVSSQRKFSNDTLDFGPKGRSGRQVSRFSNGSSDSFGSSASSEMGRKNSGSSWGTPPADSMPMHGALKPAKSMPVKTVSDEEFCEIIRKHHNKVLDQLRVDPEDVSPNNSTAGDNDSGIQEKHSNSKDNLSHQDRKMSVSKIKGLKFGFGTRRGRSAGVLKVSYADNNIEEKNNKTTNSAMKRIETMDPGSMEQLEQNDKSKNGWLTSARKYSEAFLSKLPSMSSSNHKDQQDKQPSVLNAESKSLSEEDLESISFTLDRNQPKFLRSRITSQWENLHSLPE